MMTSLLDLDEKFDVILGLSWLRRYEPQFSWHRRKVDIPVVWLLNGHLMNVIMERQLACGCTTRECDGLTCGSVVSTTAHDHNLTDRYTVEQGSGDCVESR